MAPADLERIVHRQLKALPYQPAPHTLLPRVLTAIQRRLERPWYARAFFTWPLAGQAACLAVLMVVVAAATLWLPVVHDAGGDLLVSPLGHDTQRIAAAAGRISAAVNTIEVLRRTLIEPLYAYAAIPILTMYATSVALAAALARIALGGAVQP